MTLPNSPPEGLFPLTQDSAQAAFDWVYAPWVQAANDDFLIEATVKRFGKASAYVDCNVTFVGPRELVAHAVLEFAF